MVRSAHFRVAAGVAIAAVIAMVIIAIFGIGKERKAVQRAPQTAPRYGSLERAAPDDMRRVLATVGKRDQRAAFERIYAAADYRPLWSGNRTAARRANDLQEALAEVSRQGIPVSTAQGAITTATTAEGEGRLRADLQLTEQVLRIAQGLRTGFTNLDDWYIAADDVDVAGETADALHDIRTRKLFRSLAPTHPQYQALVEALARYSEIREKGGWKSVDAGDPRGTQLRNRLAAEGYLASATANAEDVARAVTAFQERNGLKSDGRVGAATLKALNVTADERIDQILANLERWRHMPRELGNKHVAVNVADQSLALMDGGDAVWTTRTIVGDRKTPTPVVTAEINGVLLNPPWDIPPTIARNELLPKLRQDPHYLMDRNIVVTDGDAQWTLVGWDDDFANEVPGRLRQLPGVGNSLGSVKFQMDNRFNIYLHDTPNRELFNQDDRYLSHGCVRVQNPSELAGKILDRDAQAIDEEIAIGETKTLRVSPPLPVYVLYWTAFADQQGTVQFRDDAYGRDWTIVAALGFKAMQKPAQVVSRSDEMAP